MNFELLFNLSNTVIPFWLLMIIFPSWKYTEKIIRSPWIAIVPCVIYVIVLIPDFGTVMVDLSNPTLMSMMESLATPEGTTLAWAHFLAFDLLVGRWVYLDSREKNIRWYFVSPILFFVFMTGPFGLVIYFIIRTVFASKSEHSTD